MRETQGVRRRPPFKTDRDRRLHHPLASLVIDTNDAGKRHESWQKKGVILVV